MHILKMTYLLLVQAVMPGAKIWSFSPSFFVFSHLALDVRRPQYELISLSFFFLYEFLIDWNDINVIKKVNYATWYAVVLKISSTKAQCVLYWWFKKLRTFLICFFNIIVAVNYFSNVKLKNNFASSLIFYR